MKNARNVCIDYLKLFFAIQVVALHTSPLSEYNSVVSYLGSQTISRLAVPFFSAVSGYYFFKDNSKIKYLKYLKKYCFVYSFWSVLMFLYEAICWKKDIFSFLLYVVRTYLFDGWHQLWYLLAIIYTIILIFILKEIFKISEIVISYLSILLLMIGISISNYGKIFVSFPILRELIQCDRNMTMGWIFIVIPFFMLGKTIHDHCNKNTNPIIVACYAGLCLIGLELEILFTTILNLHINVAICLFTCPCIYYLIKWSICNPFCQKQKSGFYCSKLSSIIYYGHYVLTMVLFSFGVSPTKTFIFTLEAILVLGSCLICSNNSLLKKII